MSEDRPRLIYHVTMFNDWADAKRDGEYKISTRGRSLQQEGFIHASTDEQVEGVANAIFRGARNLVMLVIDTQKVKSEIRYECARTQLPEARKVVSEVRYENPDAAEDEFPHIYGPLNLDAVVAAIPLEASFDGRFDFPQGEIALLRV